MFLSLFNIVLAATSTYLWDVPLPPAPSGYLPSNLNFNDLVTYLYYWGLGIGGLLAFIRLIIAGIQWGASAGNVGLVKSAQDTMISTVFGLILLLGAWLLLNTINPQIVNPGEKITEALQQPKYESEGLKTVLVDLNTYEVKTPERVNVSFKYFTGIGGIGEGESIKKPEPQEPSESPGHQEPPGPPGLPVPPIGGGYMSLKEAGITCRWGSDAWDCNIPLPANLINILLEMKNQGINFVASAASTYGYSHQEHRAVDLYPHNNGAIMDFLVSQSAANGGCGDELFAPGGEESGVPDYGNRCYFNSIDLPTLDCSSREHQIGDHRDHFHFAITRECK